MTEPKLWDRVLIEGAAWEIVVVDANFDEELEGNQGICKVSKNLIAINREEASQGGYEKVRFHEELHAIGYEGARHAVQEFLGIDDDRMEKLEELIVQQYGHRMFGYLKQHGYLRYTAVEGG